LKQPWCKSRSKQLWSMALARQATNLAASITSESVAHFAGHSPF